MKRNYYNEYALFNKNHSLNTKKLSGTKAEELIFNTFIKKVLEEESFY